jgi:hypothetical protein
MNIQSYGFFVVVDLGHWIARLWFWLPFNIGRIESVRVGNDYVNYVKLGFWS